MPKVKIWRRADRDMERHFDYLDDKAGCPVADRFNANTKTTFALLADNPKIGAPLEVRNERLEGLRRSFINGFEKYLIYYLP